MCTAYIQFAYKVGHGRPHLTHRPDLRRQETGQSDIRKIPKTRTNGHYERLIEHPFDSGIKRMTVAYTYHPAAEAQEGDDAHVFIVMKGAFERVFERCTTILLGSTNEPINEAHKNSILKQYEGLAAQGLRVLTLCGKRAELSEREAIVNTERDVLEQNMCFLGLAGI